MHVLAPALLLLATLLGCGDSNGQTIEPSGTYGFTDYHQEENLRGPVKQITFTSYRTEKDYRGTTPGHKYSWNMDYTQVLAYDDRNQLIFEGNGFRYQSYLFDGEQPVATYYVVDKDTSGAATYHFLGDTLVMAAIVGNDTIGTEKTAKNAHGLVTYYEMLDQEGDRELDLTEYAANGRQMVRESSTSFENGSVTSRITQDYVDGDLVKTVEFDDDGSVRFEENITHTYDTLGNWTEKQINYSDENYFLETREITYY